MILNTIENIISGQVTGDSAKQIGKTMQGHERLSINRTDTPIGKSLQLEAAVPASKTSGLSSGEFVGMVADDPLIKLS